MIPRVINEGSIMFVALKRPHTVASDHPNFETIRSYLEDGGEDEAYLSSLSDIGRTVAKSSDGAVSFDGSNLVFEGEALSLEWADKAMRDPLSTRVFLFKIGDQIRVEGDEDAPDGIYTISDVDNTDPDRRIYVEEDEYFGFIKNDSIVEIIKSD